MLSINGPLELFKKLFLFLFFPTVFPPFSFVGFSPSVSYSFLLFRHFFLSPCSSFFEGRFAVCGKVCFPFSCFSVIFVCLAARFFVSLFKPHSFFIEAPQPLLLKCCWIYFSSLFYCCFSSCCYCC